MGKNKLAKFAQMEGYPHVFQYPWARISQETFPHKGRWREDFFGNDNPIVLELGCGKGEYAVGLASRFADKNFIGVDIKGARMWTGAKDSLERGLKNVAFLRTEIELLEHFFAPGEVDELWITFPDPQMKKVSKRLTGTTFIARYLRLLRPGGVIHLKSDSPFLYTYTKAMVELNGFEVLTDTSDLYAGEVVSDILDIKTYYEQQWLARGLTIKYLQFVPALPEGGLQEPDIDIEYDDYRSFGRNARTLLQ
ncbi:MAG: tRNA (guanosine(46)-N7)-methyltransferase TrmB [Porphyromonas sp.]|nr:tRNA (guanosine(46)-N7)-methyltransferase TrmB [Porphyromonas sp.]